MEIVSPPPVELDGILPDIGVTDVIIGFRNVYAMEEDKPLDEKIGMLNWYASEFIDAK